MIALNRKVSDIIFFIFSVVQSSFAMRARIQLAGQTVGVKVYPNRLRHTCATQLLNAGCRITLIQKFLGHKRLNTTMIYAKAHDQAVADDYYAAMSRIEQRLEIVPVEPEDPPEAEPEQVELLSLTEQLAQPELRLDMRLLLVAQMRAILRREGSALSTGKNTIPIAINPVSICYESTVEGSCAALGP